MSISEVNRIDQAIGEIAGLSRVLLFVAEASTPADCDRLRPGTVAMLYDIIDKADDASAEVGRLQHRAGRGSLWSRFAAAVRRAAF